MLLYLSTLGFTKALIIFIIIVLSVSFHEFTHAFIAHMRGDDTAKYAGRLTVNPVAHFEPIGFLMMLFTNFGWGKPVPINPYNMQDPQRDNVLVAIAGPLSNLSLALGASLLLHILSYLTLDTTLFDFFAFSLSMVVIINIGLAIFNLLPFPPLDGSNIYRAFLPESVQYKISSLSIESLLIIFVLAFLPIFNGQSLISLIISPIISFLSSFLIP